MHAEDRHLGWPEVGIFALSYFITQLQLVKVQEIREVNKNILFLFSFAKNCINSNKSLFDWGIVSETR